MPGADAQMVISANALLAKILLEQMSVLTEKGTVAPADALEVLRTVRNLFANRAITRESAPQIFYEAVLGGVSPEEAAKRHARPTDEVARAVIRRIVQEKADLVRAKGLAAQGPLMGIAMKELRGRVDGKLVAEWLAEELKAFSG